MGLLLESLGGVGNRLLSVKTAFLVAITSAQRVWDSDPYYGDTYSLAEASRMDAYLGRTVLPFLFK